MTECPTGGHTPARATHLLCGRSLDAVLEQVSDGHALDRDAHQQGCPHCQAALGEYERLWSPLRELAADRPAAPEGLIDQTLDKIRNAIENPDYATLPSDTGRGVTRIAGRVVVVAARQSAQRIPGVRVALGRHVDPATESRLGSGLISRAAGAAAGEPTVTAGVAGASTAIEITLAAEYGTDLRDLGTRIRDTVVSRVRELTDLEPVEVTIVIDDVLP